MKSWWMQHGSLRMPADDFADFGGGGEEEDDEETLIEGGEDDLDEDEDEDEDEGEVPARGRRSAAVDPNAIAQAVTQGLANSPLFQQQQAQQRPQMTPEELQKLIRVPANADLIAQLRDPEVPVEKALAGFQALLDNVVQHTLKLAGGAMQGELQALNPQLQAVQAHIAEQKSQAFVVDVTRKYPALKSRPNVVREALRELGQQGYQPASKSDALRAVAKRASAKIRQIDPNFSYKAKAGGPAMMQPRSGGGGGRVQGGKQGGSVWDMHFK